MSPGKHVYYIHSIADYDGYKGIESDLIGLRVVLKEKLPEDTPMPWPRVEGGLSYSGPATLHPDCGKVNDSQDPRKPHMTRDLYFYSVVLVTPEAWESRQEPLPDRPDMGCRRSIIMLSET